MLRVGSRVLGLASGAHAEYVVATEQTLAELPPSLDLVDAAALPLVARTGGPRIEEAVKP